MESKNIFDLSGNMIESFLQLDINSGQAQFKN